LLAHLAENAEIVPKLIVENCMKLSQLKQLIEILPQIETIFLKNINFGEIEKIEHEVLSDHVKWVNFEYSCESWKAMESFDAFCRYFRFPAGSLKHFRYEWCNENSFQCPFSRETVEKFMANQKQLTNIEMGLKGDVFVYEAKVGAQFIELKFEMIPDEKQFSNLLNMLKEKGQAAPKLIIEGYLSLSQLKQLIKVLPNLEVISLKNMNFGDIDQPMQHVNGGRIKTITIEYIGGAWKSMTSFNIFCKYFRLPDGSLQHFRYSSNNIDMLTCAYVRESVEKFHENQKQLIVIENELKNGCFVFEAQIEGFKER
jgi:hypothetical protein